VNAIRGVEEFWIGRLEGEELGDECRRFVELSGGGIALD